MMHQCQYPDCNTVEEHRRRSLERRACCTCGGYHPVTQTDADEEAFGERYGIKAGDVVYFTCLQGYEFRRLS